MKVLEIVLFGENVIESKGEESNTQRRMVSIREFGKETGIEIFYSRRVGHHEA
jgi:hypothetical protein